MEYAQRLSGHVSTEGESSAIFRGPQQTQTQTRHELLVLHPSLPRRLDTLVGGYFTLFPDS